MPISTPSTSAADASSTGMSCHRSPAPRSCWRGNDADELAPGFLAIPTPGHTRGHCVLLFGGRFLFTGDHLAWDRDERRLEAYRGLLLVLVAAGRSNRCDGWPNSPSNGCSRPRPAGPPPCDGHVGADERTRSDDAGESRPRRYNVNRLAGTHEINCVPLWFSAAALSIPVGSR